MRKTVFLSLTVGVAVLLLAACSSAPDGDNSAAQQGAPQNNAGGVADNDGSGGDDSGDGLTTGGEGAPAPGGVSNSLVDRKIERNATLEITAENVAGTVARIEAAATAAGGFVSQSSITQELARDTDEGPRQQGTVQIRVPAEDYSAVMSQLRGFAKDVTAENSTTQEVTAEYTDLQSQLRNLQATEAQYLKLLERAASIDEILTVQDRLNTLQAQIETVQGRINLLDNLTALATITVNVSLPPLVPAQQQVKNENWAEESWSRSWEASQDLAKALGIVTITLGVFGMWLIVPGAVGFAGWRLWERGHKREAPTA